MSALAKLTRAQRLAEQAPRIPAAPGGRHTDDTFRLEERLRARLGVPAVVAVSTPGAAIRGVLELLRPPAGGEVIVAALGRIATAFAVSDAFALDGGRLVKPGLVPVFADVDPATGTLDAEAVEAAITDGTCAVVVTHLLGQPGRMGALADLAAQRGLALIADVAPGLGTRQIGDFGCLSLAGGHAAIAITQRALERVPAAAARLRSWRELGRDGGWGLDGRLSERAAGECLAELATLDLRRARTEAIAERYSAALGQAAAAPIGRTGFVVRTHGPVAADRLRAHLGAAGIDTGEPVSLLCEHAAYATGALPCRVTELRAARALARTLVAVPAYPELGEIEIERIERALRTYAAAD